MTWGLRRNSPGVLLAVSRRSLGRTEDGYNGWRNYPTWAVNLWLSNDEPTDRETMFRTREALALPHPTSEVWTVEESR